ncbi:MAG: MalY/PatB family protein [Lachnospiraceae bacterium]|nr:MalY/PatB family protein [Lachnospiraceae bacterium]
MEELIYVDRKNTNCVKWDGQTGMFGEEGLHAMWVADMDIRAPKGVVDALKEYVEQGVFGYYKIPDAYNEAFIKWEREHHGFEVQKEWIRFSPGVVCAFHWFVKALTEPGDAVIVNTPVYYPFFHAVESNDRKLICSDLINENGKYRIDYDDFEKKIVENDVKAYILCSPHNPAGRVWREDELKTLFEICKKHNVYVISDEIHHDLVFGDHPHIPSLSVGDYADRMVAITAPSKTFNLAGGQNSIVIIPDEKIRGKWDAFVDGIRIEMGNPFGYIAAEAAYRTGSDWLEAVKAQIQENVNYVRETLERELPGVIVSPLEGTYLCWIDLKAYVPADQVKEVVQKKCHLAVDFGDWFGGERFQTFIRMNLATSLENVKIGVDALVEGIKSL